MVLCSPSCVCITGLAGTVKADVLLKLYEAIPRIDFTLELGKTISDEVESVFLSLDLNRLGNETVLRKGAREAFRPGIDQLPGTCMEFYMSDDGAARLSPEGGVLIAARDVPMFYTGEMQHHPSACATAQQKTMPAHCILGL